MRGKKRSGKPGSTSPKGKKHFRGQEDAKLKRDELRASERSDNDWQWYAQNSQLVRDYASYPFGVALGSPIQVRYNKVPYAPIPGIMVLRFTPSLGMANSENSPANIAMRNVYSFVRHANSGHTNYDSPDLMLYLLAMDSIYTYQAFLKRIIEVILDYSTLNRYYPEAILTAMGVDATDVRKHLNDLRGYVNVFTVKAGSMCVPNGMSYMRRHQWMCENIYLDSGTSKAQTYLYSPEYLLKFELKGDPAVGSLTYVSVSDRNTAKTVDQLMTLGDQLLNAIIPNEDMNIMSGDILKAFGQDGVVRLTGIAENQVILPVYNQEVLSQMENSYSLSVTLGALNGTSAITQTTDVGTGYLVENNTFKVTQPHYENTVTGTPTLKLTPVSERILNFHTPVVTPEMVMVATRLMMGVRSIDIKGVSATTITGSAVLDSCGSEFISNMEVFRFKYFYNSSGAIAQVAVLYEYYGTDALVGYDLANTSVNLEFERLMHFNRLSTFDWHPILYPYYMNFSPYQLLTSGDASPFGDIDNYTIIDNANLYNMHQVALLSEFSVPQMGVLA